MKTGSWFTTKAMPGRIGISLGTPRGMPGGYKLFKALAPDREWMNAPRAEYEARFFAKLGQLDPARVKGELIIMAKGAEPLLLCFEKPGFTEENWCHRRLVAKWFEATLGNHVPEFGAEDAPDLELTPEGLAALKAII